MHLIGSGNVGFLDSFDGGVLRGWVGSRNNEAFAYRFDVVVDGRPMGEYVSHYYRDDVVQHIGRDGIYGFAIVLDEVRPGAMANICVDNDTIPVVCGGAGDTRPRLEHPYAYMHIQKTAGTTLRDAILKLHGPDRSLLVYGDSPGVPFDVVQQMSARQLAQFDIFIGHYYYGFLPDPDDRLRYVTVLRDARARLISNVYHHNRTRPAAGGSIEEIIERDRIVEYDNYMVRSLGAVDFGAAAFGEIGQEHLALAKRVIERRFEFVGRIENIDAMIQTYKGILFDGEKLPRSNQNTSTWRADSEGDLSRYYRYDDMLYEYVLRRFG